jgi:hypothetical protein
MSGRLQGYDASSENALVVKASGAQYVLVCDARVGKSGNKMYTSEPSLVRTSKAQGEHDLRK